MMAAYRTLTRGLRIAALPFRGGAGKLGRGIRGRERAASNLEAWGRAARDEGRPVAWFHAASVGETHQAVSVADALRELEPALQVVLTHFSPSAEDVAQGLAVETADFLPWDLPERVGPVLDAVRPDLLAFTQKEVWPTLALEAARRGTSLALVAGLLSKSAGRRRWPARAILRPAMESMAAVAAVSRADADGFVHMGVHPDRVHVTGDPGVDSACRRLEATARDAPHLRIFEPGAPTLVAGSTWRRDEDVLLRAIRMIREAEPRLRVVVVPHEPDEEGVASLVERLEADAWSPRTLSLAAQREWHVGEGQAVVVDRVGFLSSLYAIAHVAFVGGGFGTRGLHSVVEPAAASVPVLFGPNHRESRAASGLIAVGGARPVTGATALASSVLAWLPGAGAEPDPGACARDYIARERGASARSAALLAGAMRSASAG
jgi:3-deoxy-D-manno-octulosonic-acid transferase